MKKVCQPKNSVGADGVIFIENSEKAAYKWDFYNYDGSSAETLAAGNMDGNGEDDVIVGASGPFVLIPTTTAGTAFIFFGAEGFQLFS